MSLIQKEVFQMIYVLPDNTLISLKPLLNELLTSSILSKDPNANINEMDEWDKLLFLQTINTIDNAEYVTFEEALIECGVSMDEIYSNN